MKTIIIDDERLARKELINLLNKYETIEIIEECNNGKEAKIAIEKHNPDLIFVDIQMPEMDGFQLLSSLDYIPNYVVFATAYDEYAIKAFETNALDYLLKPIAPKRLDKVIEKIEKQQKSIQNENSNSKTDTELLNRENQIFIKDGENCWFIKLEKVMWFESNGNYIHIFFDDKKPMIHKSLNQLEEKLDPKHFFRANRKQIINTSYIEKIDSWFNGKFKIILKNGTEIEVSRRQATKFKDLLSL